jgi:hypothetical protein
MAQTTVIKPATAAVTTKAIIRTNGRPVTVSADNLATTEECDLWIMAGATWKAVTDTSGTAQKLTASIPALVLEAGPTYAVTKDATAGACGVYVDE